MPKEVKRPYEWLKPLTRSEASLLVHWLQSLGKTVEQGWLSLWKKTPAQVAGEYEVTEREVLITSRRIQETEE